MTSCRGFGFGFEPQSGWWWGGRRRRGRRQWFGAGDMKYVILRVLAERPMHGYEVMKALEDQTHGCYKPSPGTVYPTLQWLEDEGLVTGEAREGKKVYSVTEAGRRFLEENKSTIEDIFDRLEGMIDDLVGEPMPEVNRAVGRVVGQVYRLSWKLRRDDEKRKRIVEILEQAHKDLDALSV